MAVCVYMFVCLSVCLSLSLLAHSGNTSPNFTKCMLSVAVAVAWSSSVGGACNTLCTSGFVDDVMFSHNGPNGGVTLRQQPHFRVVYVLTPLLVVLVVLFQAMSGVKTTRNPRERAAGQRVLCVVALLEFQRDKNSHGKYFRAVSQGRRHGVYWGEHVHPLCPEGVPEIDADPPRSDSGCVKVPRP